ncbi:hypothetical protein Pmar_PMAR013065 [Perkinsus marinus ATCC 50983]|uniref:Uncharacterized protein n=1 Tax=Perkinsus marinus (strain ATCC 50983 / TXsc) TaxID=423536 RepID=C5KUR2_PERM5|nr:hypothetical protein Pmar_PMAR013065 [Perkinsus marinus ATCC 50983]EER11783.1 hypothetical protein Pmar_PMAR013065 [Perkinsus marinus ATCC 50983]|eukprot:XP_002779988.1 hypothetical protein Pmar_PMAR013065 [Perkinsus marinus ATCC 50983]
MPGGKNLEFRFGMGGSGLLRPTCSNISVMSIGKSDSGWGFSLSKCVPSSQMKTVDEPLAGVLHGLHSFPSKTDCRNGLIYHTSEVMFSVAYPCLVKEGQASEGFGRSSSIGTTVDKCWVALARVSSYRSPRSVLMNVMIPRLQRESTSTEGTDLRVSAILYGVSVVLEETLYHQITARDVEAVMGGIAVLGDDTYCSERCRVLLSLHHALVPSIPPNGVIVCGLYGAMIRLGIHLLEDDSSEDAALYGFALLWSVLSSAPPEWLVSTLGLVGVRATSALRRAGKRKRDEEEELSWIPYLARYLEKLTRTVPTAALRKYSPIIAAELVSRYWSVNKKQRTASSEENLADDKVDEIIASTLYPLLCEGSAATRRSSGEAISYKSDDVLHLFASAGSDSSREKVKRMLQMYTQRFRYKGRV